MKGYKGFSKDLKCRDFQYEIGKTYETDEAKLCESGFHFCEAPLDVFNYYAPADSRFCEIEAEEISNEKDRDSKRVAKKLKIGAEIGIPGLVKAQIEYVKANLDTKIPAATNTGYRSAATNTGYRSAATNTGGRSAATNTGDRSAATNTGYRSAATNTGDRSAAANTGYRSAATNTGDRSAAINTGYRSAATNTGDRSAATNTGGRSAATNTGYRSAATNTGDRSAATNTGDFSAASVSGENSVAMNIGVEGKAKGALGCFLVLAEWVEKDDMLNLKAIKAHKVDGKTVKPDVWYKLVDGKFTEGETE